MTQHVLISGSVAFDTIMVFDGYFKDHILPERVHQINISMLTPELKRESGGCAANIAYNLRLLGGTPAILATVGKDGAEYAEQLGAMGIDTRQLLVLPEFFTPQAFVTTDKAANQIAAFHPGAMNEAHVPVWTPSRARRCRGALPRPTAMMPSCSIATSSKRPASRSSATRASRCPSLAATS